MTDAATGNERRPTVVRRYAGTFSSWDVDERNAQTVATRKVGDTNQLIQV